MMERQLSVLHGDVARLLEQAGCRRLLPSPGTSAHHEVTPEAALLPSDFSQEALRYYPVLDRASLFVRAHVCEQISLADAANVANLERKYFSTFFHAKVGVTFHEWLRALRIRHAMEMMSARQESISSVAFASGFGDVRSFERAFKTVTGMTPRAFQAAVQPQSRQLSQRARPTPRAR